MRLPAIIAFLVVLPHAALPALAADEPEVVYAKFHRAAISGDLQELGRLGPAARRAEQQTMSAAQKQAMLKMAASMMPRAFVVRGKQVNRGGRARLVVSGPGENLLNGKPETLYGEVTLVMESGEWKVDDANWSNVPPDNLAPVQPAAAAPPAARAPARPQSAPMSASPARTLGAAKPPCVYKAVMTAEDVENCR